MRHQELRLQRDEARVVLGKLDELYEFIRNSGLHYKICENFGCTVITVGRNFHRFSGVYQDLRKAPASLESQASLNLNIVLSELESAKRETAALEEESRVKMEALENEGEMKTKKIAELEYLLSGYLQEIDELKHKLSKVEKDTFSKSLLTEDLELKTESRVKMEALENEGEMKTKKIAELLSKVEEDTFLKSLLTEDLELKTEELRKAKQESEENITSNSSNISQIIQLKHKLSKVEDDTFSKSRLILDLELKTVKAKGVEETLAKTLAKTLATLEASEKANDEAKTQLPKLKEMLKQETEMKEEAWKVLDADTEIEKELVKDRKHQRERIATLIYENDKLREENVQFSSFLSSTPIKQTSPEDSGLPPSSPATLARGTDHTGSKPVLAHPTHKTGLIWGRTREERDDDHDYESFHFPDGTTCCGSCNRWLPPGDTVGSDMIRLIPSFDDGGGFFLSTFLEACNAPKFHYGYCHQCLHEARLRSALKDDGTDEVVDHMKHCEALKDVYSEEDLQEIFNFYVVTEHAIRNGTDEHKIYQFLRRSDIVGRKGIPAYREELRKLKSTKKKKSDPKEDSEAEELNKIVEAEEHEEKNSDNEELKRNSEMEDPATASQEDLQDEDIGDVETHTSEELDEEEENSTSKLNEENQEKKETSEEEENSLDSDDSDVNHTLFGK